MLRVVSKNTWYDASQAEVPPVLYELVSTSYDVCVVLPNLTIVRCDPE